LTMTPYVLATVLVSAVSASAASQTFATLSRYTSNNGQCASADLNGDTTIWAFGVCSQNTLLSIDAGNITITHYTDANCTKGGKVQFSAPQGVCSSYLTEDVMFTTQSQSFSQACQALRYPYIATYTNKACTGNIATVTSQTNDCFNQGDTSKNTQCNNGTAVTCKYTKADCQGTPTCTNYGKANVCLAKLKYVCPVADTPAFCPAAAATTKKSNTLSGGEVGGIVAASILIPLVVIAVAVVAFIFIRKGGQQQNDDSLIAGSTATYGST